jgi:serine protease inhibitor
VLFHLAVFAALVCGCTQAPLSFGPSWKIPEPGKPHPVVREQVGPGEGGRQFALDLFKSQPTGQDLAVCPIALQHLLQILSEGSEGETKTEIDKTIYTKSKLISLPKLIKELNHDVTLEAAQRIYHRSEIHIRPEFAKWVKDKFAVDILPKPSVAEIDQWVSETTHQLIRQVPQNPGSPFTLISLVYLKSDWERPFETNSTSQREFHASGQNLTVPTMSAETSALFTEQPDFRILELPFKGDRLVFDCILPKKQDGLNALEASLTRTKLDGALKALTRHMVIVYLPRFHQESRISLKDGLERLGATKLFGPRSEFKAMSPDPVQLEEGSQVVWLEVNEQGAQAAVASEAHPAPYIPDTKEFTADHPFMFLIRDRVSGTILFIGRVVHPGRKWP